MSLNCCQGLQRTDSDYDMNKRFIEDKSSTNKSKSGILRRKILAERSWSGTLMPPPCDPKVKSMADNVATPMKLKVRLRKHGSSGEFPCQDEDDELDDLMDEPKLVRSGGIRRDWSFENLEAQRRCGMRSKQR